MLCKFSFVRYYFVVKDPYWLIYLPVWITDDNLPPFSFTNVAGSQQHSKTYLEPCQVFDEAFQPLTIFTEKQIVDVWEGSTYVSEVTINFLFYAGKLSSGLYSLGSRGGQRETLVATECWQLLFLPSMLQNQRDLQL